MRTQSRTPLYCFFLPPTPSSCMFFITRSIGSGAMMMRACTQSLREPTLLTRNCVTDGARKDAATERGQESLLGATLGDCVFGDIKDRKVDALHTA